MFVDCTELSPYTGNVGEVPLIYREYPPGSAVNAVQGAAISRWGRVVVQLNSPEQLGEEVIVLFFVGTMLRELDTVP